MVNGGNSARLETDRQDLTISSANLFATGCGCNYGTHMAIVKLKVARIGNSRGVRLPAASLRRYRIGDVVLMEERSDGILLRPTGPVVEKLSWEGTAREMAASGEDWSAWEATALDGLDGVPWETADRVRERAVRSHSKPKGGIRK